MKPPLKKPCEGCPFRRTALPGWLGNSTPAEFMNQTLSDNAMPCHCTVDYSDPLWREETDEPDTNVRYCAGALVFFANICKISRHPERPRLKPDRENVFASPAEFLAYHHDWQNGETPKVGIDRLPIKPALSDLRSSRVTCCKCFHTTIKFRCPKCQHSICSSCKRAPKRKLRK